MAANKTEYIRVRLTPSEKENLKQKSKQARMSMSEYVLSLSEQKRIIKVDGVPELTVEITRIGVNVNQIAAVANSTKSVSDLQLQKVENNLEKVKSILTEILKQLYSVDDEIDVR